MDANSSHHAGWRAFGTQTPVVLAELAKVVVANVRIQEENLAQRSLAHEPLDLLKRRFEATLMTDPENLTSAPASADDALRALAGHSQRLFAKKILACGDRLESLLLVQGVRRGKHDSLNLPVRKRVIQTAG